MSRMALGMTFEKSLIFRKQQRACDAKSGCFWPVIRSISPHRVHKPIFRVIIGLSHISCSIKNLNVMLHVSFCLGILGVLFTNRKIIDFSIRSKWLYLYKEVSTAIYREGIELSLGWWVLKGCLEVRFLGSSFFGCEKYIRMF